MADYSIHVQRDQDAPTHGVLMPQAWDVKFVASEKRFHQPNQLNRQVLFIPREGASALKIQLASSPKDQVLQAEFFDRFLQINFTYV
jgi:hypothetical protein